MSVSTQKPPAISTKVVKNILSKDDEALKPFNNAKLIIIDEISVLNSTVVCELEKKMHHLMDYIQTKFKDDEALKPFKNTKLIIIDEISILNSSVLCELEKKMHHLMDYIQTKYFGIFDIVFMGDIQQLLPVGQHNSIYQDHKFLTMQLIEVQGNEAAQGVVKAQGIKLDDLSGCLRILHQVLSTCYPLALKSLRLSLDLLYFLKMAVVSFFNTLI